MYRQNPSLWQIFFELTERIFYLNAKIYALQHEKQRVAQEHPLNLRHLETLCSLSVAAQQDLNALEEEEKVLQNTLLQPSAFGIAR